MQDFNYGGTPAVRPLSGGVAIEMRPLMRTVYLWMTLGLATTGFVAMVLANMLSQDMNLFMSLANLSLPLMLVQLGIVFGMSFFIQRMSPNLAIGMFFFYAFTMGISMSMIILAYIADPQVARDGSIILNADWAIAAKAFFSAAGLFGVMTFVGYTTNVDLSRFGSFLMVALVALVVISLVNVFIFRSSGLDLALSVFGVLIFIGLTAWDTQKIKQMAEHVVEDGTGNFTRLAIMGALTLYLDFINLFLYLLRIFASRRD